MWRPAMSERRVLGALVASVVAIAVATWLWPEQVSSGLVAIPVMIGAFRLSWRGMLALAVVIVGALVLELVASPVVLSVERAALVLVVIALALRFVWLRQEWGLAPTSGMAILLDLRARVREQGEPPTLGAGWVMARGLRSANDVAFRGDFTLARRAGPLTQAMVVDTSGHGLGVAARAVQLAGGFGGLLGVVPAEQTLTACNTFVCGLGWDRDYATAAHAVLDERTGDVHVRSAGHPEPRVRRADGTWEVVDVRGPVLGLTAAAEFGPVTLHLGNGDVLVLVTDGVLDEGAADPWHVVDANVTTWLHRGSPAGTRELPAVVRADDDQTILVIARRPSRAASTASGG